MEVLLWIAENAVPYLFNTDDDKINHNFEVSLPYFSGTYEEFPDRAISNIDGALGRRTEAYLGKMVQFTAAPFALISQDNIQLIAPLLCRRPD